MARKTAQEAEKTRKNILLAAMEVFLDTGYSQARLEDIAAAAGVTRGALYWHFDQGKIQLYEELLADASRSLAQLFEWVAGSDLDGLQRLDAFFMRWAQLMEKDEYYRRSVQLMLFKTELVPELSASMAQKRRALRELQDLLGQWLIAGGFDAANAPQQARLLLASSWGLMEHWLLLEADYSLEEHMQLLLNQLVIKGEQ